MRHLESKEQQALIEWANINPDKRLRTFLIAIPNGGQRNIKEAARLKREGVRAGVSDLFFAYPVNNYAGLWIELKRPKDYLSRLTPAQELWINNMNQVGYRAVVSYGWLEAKEELLNYLDQPNWEKSW